MTSSSSKRSAPPPVTNTNPPRPARPAPPEPDTSGAALAHPETDTAGVTGFATNVGTNPGTRPGGGAGGGRLELAALLHGRIDPEQDRGQTGVRLPRYVNDAVRATSAVSRGTLSMQDIVTEAVKAYLPPEVLREAWRQHGGDPNIDPAGGAQ